MSSDPLPLSSASYPPLSTGNAPPPSLHDAADPYVSRWRRLLAFVLDSLILGAATSILCLPFFEPLSKVGVWGRLIGAVIFVLYFGLLDSRLGGGQSFGKRLLRIRVVQASGEMLEPLQAVLRSSIFALPYFLNGLPFSPVATSKVLQVLLSVVVIGVGGASAYLLLFNGLRRQGLHDLALRSYVVPLIGEGSIERKAVLPLHWYILGSILAFAAMLSVTIIPKILHSKRFQGMTTDLTAVESFADVQGVNITKQEQFSNSGPHRKILMVNVLWTGAANAEEPAANAFAQAILRQDPEAASFDAIQIAITRGYDLGIASSYKTQTFQHKPEDWE